jgi:hypothetical protein
VLYTPSSEINLHNRRTAVVQSVKRLATGWTTVRLKFEARVGSRSFTSPYRPDRLQGTLSLLSNGYRGSLPGIKRPEREADHSPPASAEVKETWIYTSLCFHLKPIWTYGIQLWGTASTSNIEILERFQSKTLRMIVDAPWYVPNTLIRRDLHCPTICRFSSHYGARLRTHPTHLAVNLLGLPDTRRLRRFLPNDLPDRF